MRAIAILTLCIAATAQARPYGFSGFKLTTFRPAIHSNRALLERTSALQDQIAACGETTDGMAVLGLGLDVAADGSMAANDIDDHHHRLTDATLACVRSVLATLTYPPQKQPSHVAWSMIYHR